MQWKMPPEPPNNSAQNDYKVFEDDEMESKQVDAENLKPSSSKSSWLC